MPDTTKSRATAASATITRQKTLSALEKREFDTAAVVEPFTIGMLTPEERSHAEAASGASTALMLKGMLHRLDPKTYAAPAQADTPEAAAIAAVRDIDDKAFARMTPRLRALADDQPRLSRLLAPAGRNIDLKHPSLGLKLARPIAGVAGLKRVDVGNTDHEDAPAAMPKVVVRSGSAAKYSRMDLVLRAVHCVDETNPEGGGSDDIVLGGVLVGASGNTKVVQSRFIGNFEDGTYVSLGELPFGQFSLRTTNGYPKTMYCILQLVESDQDDADAARELTRALSTITSMVVSTIGSPAAGAIAGAIVNTVGGLVSLFISDDAFPPYGIRARLQSENQFGSDGDSGQLRTGNIVGHGGAYRIGYRWLLNA